MEVHVLQRELLLTFNSSIVRAQGEGFETKHWLLILGCCCLYHGGAPRFAVSGPGVFGEV